ncbi:MAG TPA: YkgJ family cysteine cluster protein [Polyangiaceae bacterium]|nr:YkgJ family cysteine cluster protein [Polyangiaceae bacterium]
MTTPGRTVHHRYSDPLDLIWLRAAARLGMHVERSSEVYASWDGVRKLQLAESADFDADDSLAQLIFHEICHALVAGPSGRRQPDWGLDNFSDRDLVLEHACHRVQASLAASYGLREFFAVTTQWRGYWDALPQDPLEPSDDPAIPIARRAMQEATSPPFSEVLRDALEATQRIADLVREVAPPDSLWRQTRASHPSGFQFHPDAGLRCRECAWSLGKGNFRRCRQALRLHRSTRMSRELAACERWEPRLTDESCMTCGACCREGFDRVELGAKDDGLRKRHLQLISEDRFGEFLARPDGRCVALTGDGSSAAFRCTIYAERPRSCADFGVASAACLIARRRVRLSA